MAILRVITNPFRSPPHRQHRLVQVLPFEWVTPRPIACLGAHARSLLLLHPQLRTWYRRLTPLTQSATNCREHVQQSTSQNARKQTKDGQEPPMAVPCLRDCQPIGGITVGRAHSGPFPESEIRLLRNFADQAVIAIENTRLFEAEEARTR